MKKYRTIREMPFIPVGKTLEKGYIQCTGMTSYYFGDSDMQKMIEEGWIEEVNTTSPTVELPEELSMIDMHQDACPEAFHNDRQIVNKINELISYLKAKENSPTRA